MFASPVYFWAHHNLFWSPPQRPRKAGAALLVTRSGGRTPLRFRVTSRPSLLRRPPSRVNTLKIFEDVMPKIFLLSFSIPFIYFSLPSPQRNLHDYSSLQAFLRVSICRCQTLPGTPPHACFGVKVRSLL